MNKACSKCRVVKDLSGFNKDKHKAGGVTSQCKDCRRENTSAWRNSAAGRARFNAKQRQAYAENKTAGRVRRYKICDAKPWLRTFHSSVSNARRKGLLPDPNSLPCAVGSDCLGKIHYHHDSYLPGNELNVRPMCARHHKLWHMTNDAETPA